MFYKTIVVVLLLSIASRLGTLVEVTADIRDMHQ
jgi:hypothetical protein